MGWDPNAQHSSLVIVGVQGKETWCEWAQGYAVGGWGPGPCGLGPFPHHLVSGSLKSCKIAPSKK